MWTKEIKELERRKGIARQMGGKENVAHQHKAGKMTVRERIDALCDRGSFVHYFSGFDVTRPGWVPAANS
jgi:acetyl-CoA carboxylase carboxyltransferase component